MMLGPPALVSLAGFSLGRHFGSSDLFINGGAMPSLRNATMYTLVTYLEMQCNPLYSVQWKESGGILLILRIFIFQILQILKWKWKWKDPTCAIFLKSMGFKDIKYHTFRTSLWRLAHCKPFQKPWLCNQVQSSEGQGEVPRRQFDGLRTDL